MESYQKAAPIKYFKAPFQEAFSAMLQISPKPPSGRPLRPGLDPRSADSPSPDQNHARVRRSPELGGRRLDQGGGSGALQRPKREDLFAAVRRRELDAILVWRLDRWAGRFPILLSP